MIVLLKMSTTVDKIFLKAIRDVKAILICGQQSRKEWGEHEGHNFLGEQQKRGKNQQKGETLYLNTQNWNHHLLATSK